MVFAGNLQSCSGSGLAQRNRAGSFGNGLHHPEPSASESAVRVSSPNSDNTPHTDMAEETVSDAACWLALQQACLDQVVRELPQQLDTPIGDGGMQLSGGQRQRLAIAQALLADAPLLLLDEATSALDSLAEQAIQQALDQAMQGRTTIIIAHRLSTITAADAIAVIADGHIIEQGTHQELLAAQGRYAELFAAQHDGLIDDRSWSRDR